jgi:hypothetical protein
VNIGEPQRILEIEPIELPLPDLTPDPVVARSANPTSRPNPNQFPGVPVEKGGTVRPRFRFTLSDAHVAARGKGVSRAASSLRGPRKEEP